MGPIQSYPPPFPQQTTRGQIVQFLSMFVMVAASMEAHVVPPMDTSILLAPVPLSSRGSVAKSLWTPVWGSHVPTEAPASRMPPALLCGRAVAQTALGAQTAPPTPSATSIRVNMEASALQQHRGATSVTAHLGTLVPSATASQTCA